MGKKKLITIQVTDGSFVLSPRQVTAFCKCLTKWERLADKKNKSIERYGAVYYNHDPALVKQINEFLQDFRRIVPIQTIKI